MGWRVCIPSRRVPFLALFFACVTLPMTTEAFFLGKIYEHFHPEETTTQPPPPPIIIKYPNAGEYIQPPGDSYHNSGPWESSAQWVEGYESYPSIPAGPTLVGLLLDKAFKGWLNLFPKISYEEPSSAFQQYPPHLSAPPFAIYPDSRPPPHPYSYPPYPRQTIPSAKKHYHSAGPSPPWVSQDEEPFEGDNYQWQEEFSPDEKPKEISIPFEEDDSYNQQPQKNYRAEKPKEISIPYEGGDSYNQRPQKNYRAEKPKEILTPLKGDDSDNQQPKILSRGDKPKEISTLFEGGDSYNQRPKILSRGDKPKEISNPIGMNDRNYQWQKKFSQDKKPKEISTSVEGNDKEYGWLETFYNNAKSKDISTPGAVDVQYDQFPGNEEEYEEYGKQTEDNEKPSSESHGSPPPLQSTPK